MRKSSPSPHTQFFTSLKHLEKRLKLEGQPPITTESAPPPLPEAAAHTEHQEPTSNTEHIDSLGTPIYLNYNHSISITNSSNLQESEAPQEFLSNSPDFPTIHHAEVQETVHEAERSNLDDDIELLMQVLGLSDNEEVNEGVGFNDDGFYGKIVGIKGPKSVKEVERLEGWIKHFLNGEKKEPFALAHLLLGKAVFVNSSDDFGGFNFPCTIDEFLKNDPPPMD